MQGQRGVVGSFAGTLEFDHGSTSGNPIIDQQICWNHTPNLDGNRAADFTISPIYTNNAFASSSDQEQRNLGSWSLGEPSSSGTKNELANILSLDSDNVSSQMMQSSNSNSVPRNFNLNVIEGSDDCQIIERPNTFKSTITGNQSISVTNGSSTSGSGGSLGEGIDCRSNYSSNGQRQSRKRKAKAIEVSIGQSSTAGSSSNFNHSGSSLPPCISACSDAGSSLCISVPLDGAGPRPGLHTPDVLVAGRADSNQRNTRLRINPSSEDSSLPPLFAFPNAVRRSGTSSSHHASRLFPVDHMLDFRSLPAVNSTNYQSQPALIPFTALPQNVQSMQLHGSSISRAANSSSSIALGQRQEDSTRSVGHNILGHSVFLPATEFRASVGNPSVPGAPNGNTSLPINIASSTQAISGSGINSHVPPSWDSHPNPTFRSSRRLAEYVRRSLLSVNGVEGSNSPLPSGVVAASAATRHSSRAINPGHHHRRQSRSALLMERQGAVLGIPYPFRSYRASDGRSRLASEIRSVLDHVRRGEGLRIEDVMMLNQSGLFAVANIHDRHRDMRLDVDNLSYEELLALEERIGNVSTGLSEGTIINKLKQRKFSVAVEKEPCCICQEEYNEGEDLGALDCGHDFHRDCIKQWLLHKNVCPICKMTALAQ